MTQTNTYKVITVTNSIADNPQYKKDSIQYDFLLPHVTDEIETFIVEKYSRRFWIASEFFDMSTVKQFVG